GTRGYWINRCINWGASWNSTYICFLRSGDPAGTSNSSNIFAQAKSGGFCTRPSFLPHKSPRCAALLVDWRLSTLLSALDDCSFFSLSRRWSCKTPSNSNFVDFPGWQWPSHVLLYASLAPQTWY